MEIQDDLSMCESDCGSPGTEQRPCGSPELFSSLSPNVTDIDSSTSDIHMFPSEDENVSSSEDAGFPSDDSTKEVGNVVGSQSRKSRDSKTEEVNNAASCQDLKRDQQEELNHVGRTLVSVCCQKECLSLNCP